MATMLTEQEARERNCYLTTTGRVTGKAHEIEIWFAADPTNRSRIYLLAGGRDRSDWVRNICKHAEVRVRVGQTTYTGTGRWVDESGPEDRQVRETVTTKYQEWTDGRELSEWARTSLPVAIDIEGSV